MIAAITCFPQETRFNGKGFFRLHYTEIDVNSNQLAVQFSVKTHCFFTNIFYCPSTQTNHMFFEKNVLFKFLCFRHKNSSDVLDRMQIAGLASPPEELNFASGLFRESFKCKSSLLPQPCAKLVAF